jgi:DNA-binding MarR family transcriptional regulator
MTIYTPTIDTSYITLNRHSKNILLAILAEIEASNLPKPELGIRYRPSKWFGELTEAERQAYSRALRKLDDAGLLIRITEENRDRVAYVRLTTGGLWKALEVNPDADRDAIAESLSRTNWGADVLDGLIPRPMRGETTLE